VAENDRQKELVGLQGKTQPEFTDVRKAFESLWDHVEVGAGLTIYWGGKQVVNLWHGHRDRQREKQWTQDTLTNTYSATKGVIAMAIAKLVQDGLLDYEAKVAGYWPEFGAESKFNITVTQLLSHQAGLYQFQPAVSAEELFDWPSRVKQLAGQAPAWKPGTQFGYHSLTWGFLVGELIRRISKKSPGEFLKSQITNIADADFVLGIRDERDHQRCADIIGPNHARDATTSLGADENSAKYANTRPTLEGATLLPGNDPILRPYGDVSSERFRQAEIPASNGHGTSDGLARCYHSFLNGDLVSESTRALAVEPVTDESNIIPDTVLGQRLRRSRGFILNSPGCYMGPHKEAFGHPGTQGCVAFADPVSDVAFAYVPNQLHNRPERSRRLINTFYACLDNV